MSQCTLNAEGKGHISVMALNPDLCPYPIYNLNMLKQKAPIAFRLCRLLIFDSAVLICHYH